MATNKCTDWRTAACGWRIVREPAVIILKFLCDDGHADERVLHDYDDKGVHMYIIIATDCIFTS